MVVKIFKSTQIYEKFFQFIKNTPPSGAEL